MAQSLNAASSKAPISARTANTVEILELALLELGSDGVDHPFLSTKLTTNPPPVDEVTIYTETEDDSSTCSSVSSAEGDSSAFEVPSPTSPRSIFQPYWEKHSRESSICEQVPSPPLCDSSERSSQSTNTYERTLKSSERPNRRRRRIFSNCAPQQELPNVPKEMQSLVSALRMREVPRKTKSAPALSTAKPSSSCLRSSTTTRRRSDSSVSFSTQVDVVYFERPKEIWAAGGWSKFFSS